MSWHDEPGPGISDIRNILARSGYPIFPPKPIRTMEEKMADMIDELNVLLDEHAQKIGAIEGSVDELAKRAVDPTRLLAVMEKAKAHSARLGAIIAKFPPIR